MIKSRNVPKLNLACGPSKFTLNVLFFFFQLRFSFNSLWWTVVPPRVHFRLTLRLWIHRDPDRYWKWVSDHLLSFYSLCNVSKRPCQSVSQYFENKERRMRELHFLLLMTSRNFGWCTFGWTSWLTCGIVQIFCLSSCVSVFFIYFLSFGVIDQQLQNYNTFNSYLYSIWVINVV